MAEQIVMLGVNVTANPIVDGETDDGRRILVIQDKVLPIVRMIELDAEDAMGLAAQLMPKSALTQAGFEVTARMPEDNGRP